MKKKLSHKVFSVVASLSLLMNSFLVPVSVLAQEVVDNTAQEETQTPTPEPTVEATPIPLENPTLTSDVEAVSALTEEPVLEDAVVEVDVAQSDDILEPEVVEDIPLLPESDIEAAEEESSAQLTPSVSTDKADYAPTETVVINGSDFPINSDLAIRITWPDGIIRNSAGEIDATDTVLTDEIGSFIALYDLRGEGQEGEYLVEVLMGATVLRTTTFTDGPLTSSKVGKLEQWETKQGGNWITGALNSNNSDYGEGEAVPFRLDVGSLSTGDNPYTFSVCRDYQNGTSFGYLNLKLYNTSRTADAGGTVTSTNGPFSGVNINVDSFVEVGGSGICGANEHETQVTLTSSGAVTAYVLWGGHLASPVDPGVGTGNGASSYSGGSLHMSIEPASKDLSIQTRAIIPAGSITIIKDSQPDDPQDFSFTTTGEGLTSFILDDDGDPTLSNTEVFNGLTSGTYTITEEPVSGWTLASKSCVSSSTGSVVIETTNGVSIDYVGGEDVTCTFTNTSYGTITVRKDVEPDDGSTWDFTLTVGGYIDYAGPLGDGGQYTFSDLPADTYWLYETTKPGYDTSVTCDSGESGMDDVLIDLALGEDVVCTFVNKPKPQLTLEKIVVNDDGGQAQESDWTLYASGDALGFSGSGPIVGPNIVNATVTYTLSESGPSEYSASSWSCNGGAQVSDQITLSNGDDVICTIENDDIAPTLTLIKTVVNNNGGLLQASDFPLFINSVEVESGVAKTLEAGVLYTASETEYPGYASSTWGRDCNPDGTITLQPGDNKTCTITNDDIAPTLTLIKNLINDNGGNNFVSDFLLFIGGLSVTSGIPEILDAGGYTASEQTVDGYTPSVWTGGCEPNGFVSLLPGDNKTCSITNDDVAPTITLIKEVTNDNGGTAGESDFGLTVGGVPVASGETVSVQANTQIALDEGGYTGYGFVSITGDNKCPNTLGGTVTLDEGEDITCTITNDDIVPTLTVVKRVINDNGGTKQIGDFDYYIDGNPVKIGTPYDVEANEVHTASESSMPGYIPSEWYGDCNADGTITLLPGENKVCRIDNDDQPSEIHGMKFEDVNGNGTKDAGELGLMNWTINITDGAGYNNSTATDANGEYSFTSLSKGIYTLTENLMSGWKQTTPDPSPVDIGNGEVVQDIDFGNFELGRVQGRKYEDLNMNGTHESSEGEVRLNGWTVRLYDVDWNELDKVTTSNTGNIGQYRFENLEKGTYYTCEVLQGGWMQTGPIEGEGSVDGQHNLTGDGLAVSNGSGQGDEGNVCWRAEILESGQSRGWLKFGNIEKDPEVSNIKTRLGFEEVLVGDPTSFEIEIENSGNMTLYNPIVEDIYDADYLDFVSSSPIPPFEHTALGPDVLDYDGDGDTTENISILRWALPTNLGPGDTYILTLHFTALKATDDPELTGNTAQTIACVEDSEECGEGEEVFSEESRAEVDIDSYGVSITKSNDKSGGAFGGDEVNYTLEVTNTGDWDVLVDVTDVLPGGFTYVANSAKVDGTFQEPNLSSPGKLIWENVFVSTDDSVTITYQATIVSDIDQGIYTNLATCKGIVGREFIRGEGSPTTAIYPNGEIEPEMVECNIADSSVPIGVNFTYSDGLRGEVLGAATELPATGNDTKVLIMLLTMLALGASLKIVSYNMAEEKERKNA